MLKPVSKHKYKLAVLLCLQGLVLHACEAGLSESVEAGLSESDDAVPAVKQNDAVQTRLISVYLKPLQDFGYIPLFDGRIVVAEPVTTVPVTMAKGTVLTAGIDVVHIGTSCQVLQETYPELRDCLEEETAEFRYGAVESTATTNSDGVAQLYVGDSDKYRLRVNSWATEEDARCFWGGQETLDLNSTDVTVQVLIFCE